MLIPITGGTPQPDNIYPLKFRFDAQADGFAVHQENLHVKSHRPSGRSMWTAIWTDWKGVLLRRWFMRAFLVRGLA